VGLLRWGGLLTLLLSYDGEGSHGISDLFFEREVYRGNRLVVGVLIATVVLSGVGVRGASPVCFLVAPAAHCSSNSGIHHGVHIRKQLCVQERK
jgi:hypothetical protein